MTLRNFIMINLHTNYITFSILIKHIIITHYHPSLQTDIFANFRLSLWIEHFSLNVSIILVILIHAVRIKLVQFGCHEFIIFHVQNRGGWSLKKIRLSYISRVGSYNTQLHFFLTISFFITFNTRYGIVDSAVVSNQIEK